MKKAFTQQFTVFVFGLLIMGFFVIWLQARAAIRPVQVKEQTQTKNIQADVANIAPQAQIDITLPFTATEKANAKAGLVLTKEESKTLDDALSGNLLEPNELGSFVSAFNKMLNEKELSSDEKKMLLGLEGKKQDARDSVRYLGRKKLQENL